MIALWSMRPEGFAPIVGTRFKFVGTPNKGWRGFVECEVTEAQAPSRLRFSWVGNENAHPTHVTYTLEPRVNGTRLIVEHTGFKGAGGFLLAKLIMGPGWKKMLTTDFPAVLGDLDAQGNLRLDSMLKPKF